MFKYLEGQLDQCLPAWRAAGPTARSTLAKVRGLLTFRKAMAGVDPKIMKITFAALLVRKRLKGGIGPQKVEGRSGRGSGRHGRANGHLERPSTFGNFYHLVSILFESSSKVRGLLTFREAMAGVDPKNMKIT